MVQRRHKYNAKQTVIDGIKFSSKAEAGYYNRLKLLKKSGEIKDFEMQVEYVLVDRFEHPTRKRKDGMPSIVSKISLVVDFVVIDKDGQQYVIDVKGMRTPVFNMKAKMFMDKYQIPIILAKRRGGGFAYEEV